MRSVVKVVITILIFIITVPLFALTKEVPFLKLPIVAGMVFGIIAVWKNKPKDDSNSEDKHTLKKD